MIGDRYCDDTTNTLECSFDGGDCCGPDVNTQYCTDCQCLDGEGGRGNIGEGVKNHLIYWCKSFPYESIINST